MPRTKKSNDRTNLISSSKTGKGTSTTTEVVPFIRFCSDGTYEVCDDAVEFLSALEGPIGVISMVGPYRTGKSTLLNRCILKEQVFTVGATIQACTKGILLVKKVLEGPMMENGKPLPVIVIDTEGLGSVDATSTHDTRIFSMALLLSSLFIYNSVGAIDENALSTLSLVTNICKLLKLEGPQNVSECEPEREPEEESASALLKVADDLGREAFPPLLWLVRDFTLQLVDATGEQINPAQYLEQSLGSLDPSRNGMTKSSSTTSVVEEKNNIRSCIKNCFPLRHCITMVRPVNDESQLQLLSKGIDVPVRKLFEDQMQYVRNFVFNNIRAKKILEVSTTGKALVTYARTIVQSINEGAHPIIRDAWTLITESQCRDAVDLAKRKYMDCLSRQVNWEESVKETIECFKAQPMPTGKVQAKYLKELKTFLAKDKVRIRKQESQLAESQISTKLSDLDHFVLQSADYANMDQLRILQTALTKSLTVLTSNQIENECEDATDDAGQQSPSVPSSSGAQSNLDKTVLLTSLQSTLTRLQDRSCVWIQHLSSQIVRWKHQSTLIETELRDKIKELEELELLASAANDHEKEQQKYHEMRQKLTEENETILQRAGQAESQAELLELEVTELKSQKAAIEGRVEEVEEKMQQSLQEHERYKVEHTSLYTQQGETMDSAIRDTVQSERQRYLDQLHNMKKDVDGRVASMNSEFQAKTEDMTQKLNASQNAILQHDAVRKQLVENVRDLRTDLRGIQENRLTEQISWCKKVGEAEKSVVTLTTQKRRLEDQLDPRLPKRMKTLESECASLKSDLQFKTHEITRLEKECADTRASANKWQENYHTEHCKHAEEMMRVVCENRPFSARSFN